MCTHKPFFYVFNFRTFTQRTRKRTRFAHETLNYSEAKIYTGGVDIDTWSKLSKKEQRTALEKDWYLYYRFRDPVSGKLVKQTHIKAGANRYKDKSSRYHILKQMQLALNLVLQEGFNPYGDNGGLKEYLMNRGKPSKNPIKEPKPASQLEVQEPSVPVKEAFEQGLRIKEHVLGQDSYKKFKSRINRFQKWLVANDIGARVDIGMVTKKVVIQYLNHVLQESSPRNMNNTRTDLSSFFQTLEDNDIIKANFINKIKKLHSVPTRHKTFTPELYYKIDEYLSVNDKILHLFVQFIYYGMLRPIEVCRLRVGDLSLLF